MFLPYDLRKKYNYFPEELITKVIFILILSALFIGFYLFNNSEREHLDSINQKINQYELSHKESFLHTFLFENKISKIKKFWKINSEDELIETFNVENQKNEIPYITIIITIYNQVNCFYKALRSVQNQSIKNIEIIIVDDCSKDNSLEILEKYQKEDNRIILLKHLYNYGTIKSRSDAIKLAKGKYITILDGDDGFASRDILYSSFNIATIANLDVVEFKLAYFKNKYYRRIENNLVSVDNLINRIIYQPELKYKFIKLQKSDKHWSYLNRNIVCKLIRNEIFKKVIEFIGLKYTEDFILIFEDTINSISLFFLANSFYLMQEPGYYRSKGECFTNTQKNAKQNCSLNDCIINKEFDSIKYINFLSEKLNNSKIEGELIYNELFYIVHNFDLNKIINNNFNYFFKILELILSKFTFYNNQQKFRIINLKNQLIKKRKIITNP